MGSEHGKNDEHWPSEREIDELRHGLPFAVSDLCDKEPVVSLKQSELDAIEEGIKADRRENANLRRILQDAVDLYGKPGGPWNVPSDPGTWIAEAKDALGMSENMNDHDEKE